MEANSTENPNEYFRILLIYSPPLEGVVIFKVMAFQIYLILYPTFSKVIMQICTIIFQACRLHNDIISSILFFMVDLHSSHSPLSMCICLRSLTAFSSSLFLHFPSIYFPSSAVLFSLLFQIWMNKFHSALLRTF